MTPRPTTTTTDAPGGLSLVERRFAREVGRLRAGDGIAARVGAGGEGIDHG